MKGKQKPKPPGRGRTAFAVTAFILAVITLGGSAYFGWRIYRQAEAIEKGSSAINDKIAALEEDISAEKNRENILIQIEPHGLEAYMADSAFLYKTRFSSVRFDTGAEAEGFVRLRVPVTVTLYNDGEQTVTVERAALYPWETIFDEGFRQEALVARQAKGFFGELAQGPRDKFSLAPGESATLEIDAMLRGVYGHPAMESEMRRFLAARFSDPEQAAPDPAGDVTVKGKGLMNARVSFLLRDALAFYCDQRGTRFTLTYTIETERGNSFSATCAVPF